MQNRLNPKKYDNSAGYQRQGLIDDLTMGYDCNRLLRVSTTATALTINGRAISTPAILATSLIRASGSNSRNTTSICATILATTALTLRPTAVYGRRWTTIRSDCRWPRATCPTSSAGCSGAKKWTAPPALTSSTSKPAPTTPPPAASETPTPSPK